jgi:hypothetical protein
VGRRGEEVAVTWNAEVNDIKDLVRWEVGMRTDGEVWLLVLDEVWGRVSAETRGALMEMLLRRRG